MPVEQFRMAGPAEALVKLAGINHREEASAWTGQTVYLPLSELPTLSGDEDFYYYEVIGAELLDETHGRVGTILNVLEMPGQDLLEVEDAAGKRHLVPITDAFIGAYDREARRLAATLPEGLLEL
mgnify:CR=1 FL=1